ncbi:MAG: hypothetical protein VKJ06_07490 [Vampirovibrionales bacterium]|nr:hypothetical protein [Vampirovibrionales bacterium]
MVANNLNGTPNTLLQNDPLIQKLRAEGRKKRLEFKPIKINGPTSEAKWVQSNLEQIRFHPVVGKMVDTIIDHGYQINIVANDNKNGIAGYVESDKNTLNLAQGQKGSLGVLLHELFHAWSDADEERRVLQQRGFNAPKPGSLAAKKISLPNSQEEEAMAEAFSQEVRLEMENFRYQTNYASAQYEQGLHLEELASKAKLSLMPKSSEEIQKIDSINAQAKALKDSAIEKLKPDAYPVSAKRLHNPEKIRQGIKDYDGYTVGIIQGEKPGITTSYERFNRAFPNWENGRLKHVNGLDIAPSQDTLKRHKIAKNIANRVNVVAKVGSAVTGSTASVLAFRYLPGPLKHLPAMLYCAATIHKTLKKEGGADVFELMAKPAKQISDFWYQKQTGQNTENPMFDVKRTEACLGLGASIGIAVGLTSAVGLLGKIASVFKKP